MNSKIFKHHFLYKVLFGYVKIGHRLFYKKIIVLGKENLDFSQPQLIAANHQNGLMDALAVLMATNKPIVFLARADIFKNKKVVSILKFLRILPVYRIRDGVDNLQNNDKIFDLSSTVINDKMALGIFPEASHLGEKRIRNIKKGIARIAFNDKIDSNLKIIPTGIDYSHYFGGSNDLVVNFGTPLKISQFKNDEDNRQKEIRNFMLALDKSLRNQVIDIPKEDYDTIFTAIKVYTKGYFDDFGAKYKQIKNLAQNAQQWNQANTVFTQLKDATSKYNQIISDKLNTVNKVSTGKLILRMIILLLFLPIFPLGWIVNFLPYRFTQIFAKKIKDKHLQDSIQFVSYLFVFPLYYILLGLILSIFLHSFLWLIAIPLVGILTLFYQKKLERLINTIRLNSLYKKDDKEIQNIENKIITLIKKLKDS